MAITVTHHTGADNAFFTSLNLSFTKSLAAGTIVLVSAIADGNPNTLTCTDTKGNAYTIFDINDGGVFTHVVLCYSFITNAVTAADHATFGWSGTDGPAYLDSIEGFSTPSLDPAGGNPARNPASGTSFSGAPTSNPTGTLLLAAGSVMYVAASDGGGATAFTTGTKISSTTGANRNITTGYRQNTGSTDIAWTTTAGDWMMATIGFKDTPVVVATRTTWVVAEGGGMGGQRVYIMPSGFSPRTS